MYSNILELIKSETARYVAIAAVIVGLVVYWYIITTQRDNAIEAKKHAENNVILVTDEFDRLYSRYGELKDTYDNAVASNRDTINRLNELHKREIDRTIRTTTIKTKIKDVRDEDDGNVSNILSSTLDAIRMYK